MKRWLVPWIVFVIYKLFQWTWRIEVHEPEEMKAALRERRPFILSHWHGDELVLLHLIGKYRIATIVSKSSDGDIMNRLVALVGGKTSRGSSSRGAVSALKGLMRLVRDGANCSFAVDGPKGPVYKVKPGVFELSRTLNVPIYWAGVACDRAFRFEKSWNKTFLPKPFSKVIVQWHGPRPEIARDQDPRDPELAHSLEVQLNAAKQQARAFIAEA